ncbi:MAG: pilin [Candidatus Saccharimonadales bacterium]
MKKLLLVISLVIGLAAVSLAPATVLAAPNLSTTAACAGLTQIDASQDCSTGGQNGLTGIVSAAVKILSYIVGIAAIIMVIVAGLKYIASGGDSGKISSAKNTLVYALIGLAIAALAQFLVHFVLSESTKSVSRTPADSFSSLRVPELG